MSSLSAQVEHIALPVIEARGAFLVDLAIRGERTMRVVELYIDTAQGMSAELCADISRQLSPMIDEAGIIQGRYHLVVSSPGVDRPLKFPQQYPKNVGRRIKLKLQRPEAPATFERMEGELVEAAPDAITVRLEKDDELRRVPFTEIAEAYIMPRW